MLVLSRKIGEILIIEGSDGPIEITIVDIRNRGSSARLGIEAPRHIAVHRKEVYEAIQREKQQ
jgi:carbon storage regulator